MPKKTLLILVVIAASLIVWSFFLPWARVKASVTKVAKQLTGTAKGSLGKTPVAGKVIRGIEGVTDTISQFGDIEIKTTVRGYDIPRMVNRKISKVALALAAVLFKGTENLDVKSYLVYLLPVFAVVCAVLALMGLKGPQPIFAMLIISGAISIGGLYNLLTADFSSQIVHISIEKGLWYAMYAYLFIFIVGIAWLVTGKRSV